MQRYVVLPDDVAHDLTRTSFKTAIGNRNKAEADTVEGCSLKGISDPKLDMVETKVLSNLGLAMESDSKS